MELEGFEKLVDEAVRDLPEKIRKIMENVAIVIEDSPTREQLKSVGVRYNDVLLGLYEGIPQTRWGKGFGGNLPDKITIFQQSIESIARSQEDIKNLVRDVVWHEIAHHFGFNEKEVKSLEYKRSKKHADKG
ncbi:MAG: metallopeptidase family protein [Candidatus Paceibacterota bacterium]